MQGDWSFSLCRVLGACMHAGSRLCQAGPHLAFELRRLALTLLSELAQGLPLLTELLCSALHLLRGV